MTINGINIKLGGFMVFNTTFNNISVILWPSVLLMEETGVPGENQIYTIIYSILIVTDCTGRNCTGGV